MTEREPTPEQGTERDFTPRVYVADLAAYNNGLLHGEWVDATQDPEDMWAAINAMLARSPIAGAEEIAIHDFEMGPVHLSEYESIETISRLGRGYDEHGIAFLHWAAYVGTSDPDDLDRFDGAYRGQHDSLTAWAEEFVNPDYIDSLLDEHLPSFIRNYVTVDYEALGSDLAHDCHVAEDGGSLHVFEL